MLKLVERLTYHKYAGWFLLYFVCCFGYFKQGWRYGFVESVQEHHKVRPVGRVKNEYIDDTTSARWAWKMTLDLKYGALDPWPYAASSPQFLMAAWNSVKFIIHGL